MCGVCMNEQYSEAAIAWEGDSLEVLRSFPSAVRVDFGLDLRRLQMGKRPINSRPMKSIGKRVYELRQQDSVGWYRIVYLAKVQDTIYVLHCFQKQSGKTSPRDLRISLQRLKNVIARLGE